MQEKKPKIIIYYIVIYKILWQIQLFALDCRHSLEKRQISITFSPLNFNYKFALLYNYKCFHVHLGILCH